MFALRIAVALIVCLCLTAVIVVVDDESEGDDGSQAALTPEEISVIDGALRKLEEIKGRIEGIVDQIGAIIGRG